MNRLETVKGKYPTLNWDSLSASDPSKNFKYLDWLGSNASQGTPEQLKETLILFEKKKDKLAEKDIQKYTFEALLKALHIAGPSRSEKKISGSQDLGEIDGVRIIFIEGAEAVKTYCAETKWCISNIDTFRMYAKGSNIFVLIRNNIKICMMVSLKSNAVQSIWTPDDKEHRLLSKNYIFDFANINLENVKKTCIEFTSKHKNIWSTKVNGDYKTYIEKLLKVTDEKEIWKLIAGTNIRTYDSSAPVRKFIKFIFENKETYQNFITVIEKSKLTYRDTGYCYSTSWLTYSSYWKSLFPQSKSPDCEKTLKQIKKLGGMGKILANKDLCKGIRNLLKDYELIEE